MGEQERLHGYLHTLEVCRRLLPANAHPAHRERLREIEGIVRRVLAEEGRAVGAQQEARDE